MRQTRTNMLQQIVFPLLALKRSGCCAVRVRV
jgi:hypothetical protein